MYWISLILDDPNSPVVRTRLDPNSEDAVKIPASHGPVPGPHALELRRISHIWPFDAFGEYQDIDKLQPTLSKNPTLSVHVAVDSDGMIRVNLTVAF